MSQKHQSGWSLPKGKRPTACALRVVDRLDSPNYTWSMLCDGYELHRHRFMCPLVIAPQRMLIPHLSVWT